jgi:DnaJ-class molecular chaperone
LLYCPHCKFGSRYDAEFITDAIHDHKKISCVACGGHFQIIIEGLTRAAELHVHPTTEQKCPRCKGTGRTHIGKLDYVCPRCKGTGISKRSAVE